jgi:hypothetical protein
MPISTQTTTTRTTTTIEVEIRHDPHHGWTIEAKDSAANMDRFLAVEADFKQKRERRNPKKPLPKDHFPVVFNEGETLKFTCAVPLGFGIGSKKDPDVDEFPGAPDNPFGWSGIQTGTPNGSVSAVVKTIANGPGVKDQAFYKFHGWVRLEDGSFVPVDPCGYCGS